MIKLIVGLKGSGKTKQMVDMINHNLTHVKGDIVCIETSKQLSYNIKTSVRLIDVDEYKIDTYEKFYGFLCGVLAGNYDIEQIYVDGILKACQKDMQAFGELLEMVDAITKDKQVVFTLSADKGELTEKIEKYL